MIRATILGATGYSGGELIRLLRHHPAVQIQHMTSESSVGKPLSSAHPQFRSANEPRFEKLDVAAMAKDTDVVFSCLPAVAGIKPNAAFVKAGKVVIDLSADFRLPTAALYERWYKEKHTAPHLLKTAVYGLPELFREKIRGARLIANPGCYATASALAAYPLLKRRLIDPDSLIIDAKSGVSGAGKKVAFPYIYAEVNENFQAYGVASHRHQPEIEHTLSKATGVSPRLTFTPHLVPMQKGILAVLYATLKKPMKTEAIRALFADAYATEPFVRVLPLGELPHTKNVVNTNPVDIRIAQDERLRRVIVLSALDNLVKGAAGQAVQNMNLCFARPETEGLL